MKRTIPTENSLLTFATLVFISAAPAQSRVANITVTSRAFQSGGTIPDKFTCKGANQNPPLQFAGVPPGAKSLVLIVEDPDAPDGLFSHWLLWNIDPATTQIAEKSVPPGASQGQNNFGNSSYGGPCPPSGSHRYFFRLFALDRKVDLKPGAKRSALDKTMAGHVLGRGQLMGRYGR
jgi:Raf kinase inhibitor-like YbhB/YbcL family protein